MDRVPVFPSRRKEKDRNTEAKTSFPTNIQAHTHTQRMVHRSLCRRSPLWLQALAACQQNAQLVKTTRTTRDVSWVATWSRFFHQGQLNSPGTNRCFDLVPYPLLRSMGQHWVDVTLHAVVAARLAEVYPQAQWTTTYSQSPSTSSFPSSRPAAASTAHEDREECGAASFEALLATWSAHTLLAAVCDAAPSRPASASSRTLDQRIIEIALSKVLPQSVFPVVAYLTRFSTVCEDDARLTSLHVIRRALVLVLSSFWSEWQQTEEHSAKRLDAVSKPCRSPSITPAESALSQQLLQCIDSLEGAIERPLHAHQQPHQARLSAEVSPSSGKSCGPSLDDTSRWSTTPDAQALRHETDAQLKVLRTALHAYCHVATGSSADGHMLYETCSAWANELHEQAAAESSNFNDAHSPGAAQRRVSMMSPFVGITGVQAATDEPDEVLVQINEALSRVAVSSTRHES